MCYAYEFVSFDYLLPISIYKERKKDASSENSSSDESSKENEASASTSKCKTREYVVCLKVVHFLPAAYFSIRPF